MPAIGDIAANDADDHDDGADDEEHGECGSRFGETVGDLR